MLKIAKHLKPYLWQIAAIFALVYIQVMADLALPDYMSRIINEGIVQGDTGAILQIGLQMLGIALGGSACAIGVGYFAARVGSGFGCDLRGRLYKKVMSFSLGEIDRFSTASLITRTSTDVNQVQMVLMMLLRMVLSAPIMGVGAVIKAWNKEPSMTWIIAVAVALMVTLVAVLFTITMPRFKKLQQLIDRLALVTRERLSGMRVIRAFTADRAAEAKFDVANGELTRANLFVNRMMSLMQPAMMLIMNFVSLGIIWIGAQYVGDGALQIGDMMAFMQYAMQVIMAFLMVSVTFIIVPRASVAAGRIAEVLAVEPSIKEPESPRAPRPDKRGTVEFRDVRFRYPGGDGDVLQGISFTALPGKTTAIVGSTGSGKTSILNLIPRLYDVTGGEVLLDGVDVRELSADSLRAAIGFVPQRAGLFSGTVASNIAFGAPNATREEICAAAAVAQAEAFIDSLELGYDSPISQGGVNVSGGQKQRLSIARALAVKPEVLIFDDSFSALDFRTDAMLRKALREKTAGTTVIVVAQRVGTILDADLILVLDEGRIVGRGTHRELLEGCPVYAEIALSQLSREELA